MIKKFVNLRRARTFQRRRTEGPVGKNNNSEGALAQKERTTKRRDLAEDLSRDKNSRKEGGGEP